MYVSTVGNHFRLRLSLLLIEIGSSHAQPEVLDVTSAMQLSQEEMLAIGTGSDAKVCLKPWNRFKKKGMS